ncbi:MAG: hypothetical protein ACLQJ0_04640 [Steroidobacteraceae bacterium]
MTNTLKRGSAPNRAQPDDARSGSFKSGHEKQGGRKRGTPNRISADYRKAMLEAAYRVGYDGNGKDGVVGYLIWVGLHHAATFGAGLNAVLLLQFAETNMPERPPSTREELNQRVRDSIGLAGKNRTEEKTVQGESQSPWDWTGQPFPVGSLMQMAVANPKAFCTLLFAACLPPPTRRRGRAANRS